MRVLIIGVGGTGAAAAWRLAKAGHDVTALEQFPLDHDKGSSYGDSRIIRRVYPDALYTGLMADAYTLWDELQAEMPDEEIFRRAGGIYAGPEDNSLMQAAQTALSASGVPYHILDSRECCRRFPAFSLRADRNEIALYEPSMGYVRASRAVLAMANLARRNGAQIIESNPVTRINRNSSGVSVQAESGEKFEADRLIIAGGAWTQRLLEPLGVSVPLTVSRQSYIHLKPKTKSEDWNAGRFPVWIDAEANTYGFPQISGVPSLKIGLHDHGIAVTPETVLRELQEEDVSVLLNYAAGRFPGIGAEIVYEKVCLYTNTPDEDFIIDRVPGQPNIIVLSACSGHGFKFAPLLGRIAADLAAETPVPYGLSRFRLSRFAASNL